MSDANVTDGKTGQTATDSPDAGGDGYKPPQTQADLDRIVQQRVRRAEEKFSDYDDVKRQLNELQERHQSDSEKAISAAREEASRAAQATAIPRVVRAEFKAAAKGVLSAEQLTSLLEDLDLSKYANSKGEPNEDKIANKVNAFAPSSGSVTTTSPRNLGQGNQTAVQPKPGERGRAEAEKRFGKRS